MRKGIQFGKQSFRSLRLFVAVLILLSGSFSAFEFMPLAHAMSLGNLVVYWKLDESTAGSTAVDSSGNGNNLTPSGSPQPSTNVPSNISFPDSRSLSFNGSNTLDEANPIDFNYGTSPRSISAWIYPTAAPSGSAVPAAYGQCAYNSVSTNTGMEFGFFLDSSMYLHFWGCGSNYDFNTNQTVALDQWSNVTVTYDGTNVTVYLNGTNVGTQTRSLVPQGSSTPQMEIGSASLMDGGPDYFTGNVDDVRVYTRALSSTEVSELVSSGNTSATWIGNSSTDWQNSSNWNINAVPDEYTDIVVGSGGTYQPSLTAATGMASLVIDQGGSLNLNGMSLTMNDSGGFTNNGTLILQGSEAISGLSNDTTSGTVEYDGSGSYSSLDVGNAYNNLTFNGSGSWSSNGPLTINGNLNIANGTLSSGGNNLTIAGNWSNCGTYTPGNNTVTLSGSSQSISGSTTFYNLTKSASSADTLTFEAGKTQTVTNNLILTGVSGQLLSLESSSPGTQWNLNPSGTYSLGYLTVKDGNNLASSLLSPSNSVDNGDNLNWFPPYKPTAFGPTAYVNGSYTGDSTPTLSFDLSNSDTQVDVQYQIEIANNSSFTNPIVNYVSALVPQGVNYFTVGQSAGSGNYLTGSIGQTLLDGSYFWRVQMLDSSGNSSGYVPANSGSIAFTVDTTPPTVPGTPSTMSPTTSGTPIWSWSASTDSGSGLATTPYTIEWSKDSTFTMDVSSTTSTTNSLTLPVVLTPGTWYLRVKASDAVGNESGYSPAGSVTITGTTSSSNDGDYDDTNNASQIPTAVNGNTSTSTSKPVANATTPVNTSNVLLNNYNQYTSGAGKQEDLTPNQVVYFKVDTQTHSVTVDKVGGDYVTLTLRSTPQVVTIQTGDTNEYDVTGEGKPEIKITLLGTRDGMALLSFAQVGLPAVGINHLNIPKRSSSLLWLFILLIVILLISVLVILRWKRKTRRE